MASCRKELQRGAMISSSDVIKLVKTALIINTAVNTGEHIHSNIIIQSHNYSTYAKLQGTPLNSTKLKCKSHIYKHILSVCKTYLQTSSANFQYPGKSLQAWEDKVHGIIMQLFTCRPVARATLMTFNIYHD